MGSNLFWRIVTGVITLPVLFFAIDYGGWAYSALVTLVVTIGVWEFWRLCQAGGAEPDFPLLLVGALGTLQGASDPRPERFVVFLGCFLVVALLAILRFGDGQASMRLGRLLLGIFYVGLLPAFLLRMRDLPFGRDAVVLLYAAVFACDTFAYVTGRWWGRHRLWPRISPKKTWEGAIGGVMGATAVSLAGQLWFAEFLSPAVAVGMGLLVGVVGQSGDLVESLLKREAGEKDSSQILPGHGGVLDRFDSLHLAAPAVYVLFGLLV